MHPMVGVSPSCVATRMLSHSAAHDCCVAVARGQVHAVQVKSSQGKGVFDIQDLMFRYTFDSIAEIAFGVNLNSMENVSAAQWLGCELFSDARVAAVASLVTDRAGSWGLAAVVQSLVKSSRRLRWSVGSRLRVCSACPYGQTRVCVPASCCVVDRTTCPSPGPSTLLRTTSSSASSSPLGGTRTLERLLSTPSLFPSVRPPLLVSPLHLPAQSAQSSLSTPSSLIASPPRHPHRPVSFHLEPA